VVYPDAEAECADEDARVDHDWVSEEWLLGERREDFTHQAEGWEDEDVDLWVAEDPEQVLPEEWVGAFGGFVEGGAEEAVHH